jgi:DDE domain
VDETYVRAAGRRRYVYRAIDQFGQVIDMLVPTRRDACAAHRFFEPALGATKITPVEERAVDAADVSGPCGLVGQSRPVWSSVRTTDQGSFGGVCLLPLIIHQSGPDGSKDDQDEPALAEI